DGLALRLGERALATALAAHRRAARDAGLRVDLAQAGAGAVARRAALAVAVRVVLGLLAVRSGAGALALAGARRLALAHAVRRHLDGAFAGRSCGARALADHAQLAWLAALLDGARVADLLGVAARFALLLHLEVAVAGAARHAEREVRLRVRLHDRRHVGGGGVAGAGPVRVGDRGVGGALVAPGVVRAATRPD